MTRHLAFEGIENFRDFGDYPTVGGGRLKRGRLFRSAAHTRATDADLEALAALKLSLLVDLRRKHEREKAPSRRHEGFAATVIENHRDDPSRDPWVEFIRKGPIDEASTRDYMRAYAYAAAHEPSHVELFSRYFQALAATDGAVLIHCAAGKDRTGLLAALTHHIAGVHPDDILADFLLTNQVTRTPARIAEASRAIEKASGRAPPEAAVSAAVGVDAEYLASSMGAIRERNGTTDAYIRDVLGVDEAMREAILARLLG